MARRVTRMIRGVSRQVRQNVWLQFDQANITSTGATTLLLTSLNAAALALRPFTIVRTRGMFHISSDQTGALEFQETAYGSIVVSDEAVAVGATAIPRPFDDAGWDGWLMWQSYTNALEFGDATGFMFPAAMTWQIDSKGMRKVSDNETVVLMCESQTGAVRCAMHLRILFKLS